jgi:hypothetical protein
MMVLKMYDKVAMCHNNHEDNIRPVLLIPTAASKKTAKTLYQASNHDLQSICYLRNTQHMKTVDEFSTCHFTLMYTYRPTMRM